jgi:hypothetical protein
MAAGVIDQDAPHLLGGNAEEVTAILPLHIALVNKAQIGFIHESGGL